MELYLELARYLGYSLAAVATTVAAGCAVLFAVQRFNPRLKDVHGVFRFILCFASGAIVLPTIYAAYFTNGKTVLWVATALMIFALLHVRKIEKSPPWNAKWALGAVLLFALGFASIALIRFDFTDDRIFRAMFHYDSLFYAIVEEAMRNKGVESVECYPLSTYSENPRYFPYHYYDIWLSGLWATMFGINTMMAHSVVMPAVFNFGIMLLAALLVFMLSQNFVSSMVLGISFLFLGDIVGRFIQELLDVEYCTKGDRVFCKAFYLFKTSFHAYVVPYRAEIASYFKIVPLFFYLTLFLFFSTNNLLLASWAIISLSLVFNLANISIVLGMITFQVLKSLISIHIHGSKICDLWYNMHSTLIAILLGAFTILSVIHFGSIVGNPFSLNHHISYQMNNLSKEISHSIFHVVVMIIVFSLYGMINIFVFFPYSIKTSKIFLENYCNITILCGTTFVISLTMYQISARVLKLEDGLQFFFVPLTMFSLFYYFFLINNVMISWTSARVVPFFLALFYFINMIHYIEFFLYNKDYNKDDAKPNKQFIRQILTEPMPNRLGVHMMVYKNRRMYNNIHDIKINYFLPTKFLNHYTPEPVFPIPIFDLQVPIDTLNSRERSIQKQFVFLKYYNNLKTKNPSITEREAQIAFMKERKIEWVYVEGLNVWPSEWDKYVRKKIKDDMTGDMMIFLKPWSEN